MDRRLFLTGLLGLAGAATIAGVTRPAQAMTGLPGGSGILDELEASSADLIDAGDGPAEVIEIDHRRHHRRRQRRRVWRRVCRRYRRHGRWLTRCHRERVWVWGWA